MKRFALLMAVLFVVGLFTGCPKPKQEQPETAVPALIGENPSQEQAPTFSDAVTEKDEFAPDFALADPEGNQVTKEDYSGKVLVLDFWATNCSSCVKKLDEYMPLFEKYKDQGVEWLAVSLDIKPEVAAAGAADHKWPYRVAMFNDEMKASYFADQSVLAIPQVRIIDRDGNLRFAFTSASTAQDLELALKTLVEETVGGDEAVSDSVGSEETPAQAPAGKAEAKPAPKTREAPGLPESFDSKGAR